MILRENGLNIKMNKTVLITGGAGFIGKHLALRLIKEGHKVRILDNFSEQVHLNDGLPNTITDNAEVIRADVRDLVQLKKAMKDIDTIVHYAAETGTGQSMYEIHRYYDVNIQGTSLLLDLIQNDSSFDQINSLILASSRSVYGEGAYECEEHGSIFPNERLDQDMAEGSFEHFCPKCQRKLKLIPTKEDAPLKPVSIYALSKYIQEQSMLIVAKNKGLNAFALRYQNVFGPGQSLSNPYTGILAIFSNLARKNQPINIFEDGLESRDFVYIDDVIESTLRCIQYQNSFVGSLNVGTGKAISVLEVASSIVDFFQSQSELKITGDYRRGDIRHNIADMTASKKILNYVPKTLFKDGLSAFLQWTLEEPAGDSKDYTGSLEELKKRNLLLKTKKQ